MGWANRKSKLSVHQAAKSTLARILAKLSEIALEAGIGVTEIEALLRQVTVALVAERQVAEHGRLNVSGISAATGLSRTAVAQALRKSHDKRLFAQVHTQFMNRVLGSWYRDPRFVGSDGLPATLPIFGKGTTFEALTKKYGGGVPVRALLDELARVSAVEILPDSRVRPKSNIAINRGVDPELIESIGLRTEDLLQTFLSNLRQEGLPKFVATVQSSAVSDAKSVFVQREVEKRSATFLSEIEEALLPQSKKKKNRSDFAAEPRRIGVTVFFYDHGPRRESSVLRSRPRKNLKRS